MPRKIFICLLVFLIGFQSGCGKIAGKGAFVADKNGYYEAQLDFSSGRTHKQVGGEYAEAIMKAKPDFEALLDSYISELTSSEALYNKLLSRVNDIKPRMNQAYRDEIEGMALKLSGGTTNERGDTKVSMDELYAFNLIPDIVRGTQCSALSVYGSRSSTGKAMIARALDWNGGDSDQLIQLQAVTTIKNPGGKICSIGYLGYLGIISGFNDSGVFAAILDSTTGGEYSSAGKRSYPMDLRFALENRKTLDEVAAFMGDPANAYAFNHLIALADAKTGGVLENNISGTGSNMRRALRRADSPLNEGITWGISDAVGCVNSFLLAGNHDNHSDNNANTGRWHAMKEKLLEKGDKVTLDGLKDVISFHHGEEPGSAGDGDLYNTRTQQIVMFQPDSFHLEVFFRPKGSLPPKPVFREIPVFQ